MKTKRVSGERRTSFRSAFPPILEAASSTRSKFPSRTSRRQPLVRRGVFANSGPTIVRVWSPYRCVACRRPSTKGERNGSSRPGTGSRGRSSATRGPRSAIADGGASVLLVAASAAATAAAATTVTATTATRRLGLGRRRTSVRVGGRSSSSCLTIAPDSSWRSREG